MDFNAIPRRHVGSRGPMSASTMFVGEAPGRHENACGMPFVGDAGSELHRYCAWAGVDIDSVYITNLFKYWPYQDFKGKQLPPSPAQIKSGEAGLQTELAIVQPKVIVAIGAYAARHFLKTQFQSMRRDHGVPRQMLLWTCGHLSFGNISHTGHTCRGESERAQVVTILPTYHPAAGLHSDREQVFIQEDFLQLGRLIRDQIAPHPVVDEHPVPKYMRIADAERYSTCCNSRVGYEACGCFDLGQNTVVDGPELVSHLLAGATEIAIDTEGTISDPWCLTFSVRAGESWLIRSTETECLAALNQHINAYHSICTVLCHYLAHDIPVCMAMGVDLTARGKALNLDGSLALRCTMSEAYLLGTEPKGLKPLSWRLSGMEMQSYEDLVGPTEEEIAKGHLQSVWDTLQCSTCHGVGKVPAIGKKGQQLKRQDKCPTCIDGLLIPKPDREFIFDSSKQQWRWKQPQSLGKWIQRRLTNGVQRDDSGNEDNGPDSVVGSDDDSEAEVQTDTDAGEPAAQYFKLRRDWSDLLGRSDRSYVDAVVGPMRRTTLSDVGDQTAVTRYACRDADAVIRDAPKLQARLEQFNLKPIQEQDAAFIPMLSKMEQIGMKVDRQAFVELHEHLQSRMDEIRDRLSAIVGSRTNPNSPTLADVLFRDLGLPPIKLTKSGKRESIDDDVLGALRARLKKRDDGMAALGIQILDCITDYREVLKIDGYADAILLHADRNNRIHTVLSYTTAATGRLTSSEPINLQTLPNPDNYAADCPPELNYGRRIRSAFIEDDDYVLIGCDYASIEMLVGAHLTQDAGLLRIFREGLDPHKYAANLMFGIPYDEVPKAVRTQVKPINFGAFYGIGPDKLQMQLATLPSGAIDKTVDECADLLTLYFEKFPGILEWKQQLWEDATRTGYVQDWFGRIRWVPGLRSNIRKVRSAAEREAGNMPIQSTANGIIRVASRYLDEVTLPELRRQKIECDVIMQTHDENVFRCRREYAEIVAMMVADTMRNAVTLSVPIKVEAKIGLNLYEIK